MKIRFTLLFFVCLCTLGNGYAQVAKIREGVHNFTLQWISWDQPGKVTIKKSKDSAYTISGAQYSPDKKEFVTIEGTFKVLSPQELLFDGVIRTQTSSVNKGEVCEKKGTYHFLAKGARKYWRLQEMDNCEGNNVVDYVDIYF